MRWAALVTAVALIAIAVAAYSSDKVVNYMAYANTVSRAYAIGENRNASGWRPCEEAEYSEQQVGVVCEGTRSMSVHAGLIVDVNYFCEFQFNRSGDTWKVQMSLCQ